MIYKDTRTICSVALHYLTPGCLELGALCASESAESDAIRRSHAPAFPQILNARSASRGITKPPSMKLSAAFSLFGDLWGAIQVALPQTLRSLLRSPQILLDPKALSRLFMSYVWTVFGDGMDQGYAGEKKRLVTPNAHGVVLDIGAG